MKNTVLFSLALFVGVSCVPAQAVTPWVAVKNSFKIAGALGLIWIGADLAIQACSAKAKAKMREDFLKARAEVRELAQKAGADMAQFDAETFQIVKTLDTASAVAACIGTGMAVGGLVLGYKGIMGFFPVQTYETI